MLVVVEGESVEGDHGDVVRVIDGVHSDADVDVGSVIDGDDVGDVTR